MESSDEDEDDMLTIKRKDHEIQEDDGKIINFQAYKSKSAHPLKSLSSLYS